MEGGKKTKSSLNGSFVTGAIALVFLILGYQVALFVHKAALTRIAANRDHPDTVYVFVRDTSTSPEKTEGALKKTSVRKNAPHSPEVERLREQTRRVESFPFNPNTVSVEELRRLGFSAKQAQAIENYRQKGGRFHRPADFAKSFVVADSVYRRLAPYIHIPRLDLNRADSTALLDLPGIGPYFAGKIVAYRERLGGYSRPEQLLEIYHFDKEKYDGLRDLVYCSEPEPFAIWTLPEAELARHPHISRAEAHSIVLYREHQPREAWTLEGLKKAGVLSEEHADRLSLCRLD